MAPTKLLPPLRWLGGKRKASAQIAQHFNGEASSRWGHSRPAHYLETFTGGGAVFLELLSNGYLDECETIILTDANEALIALWWCIVARTDELLERALYLERNAPDFRNTDSAETYFCEVRNTFNMCLRTLRNGSDWDHGVALETAFRMLWLTQNSHGGLYRESSTAGYNVPVRKDGKAGTIDADNINRIADKLWRLPAFVGFEVSDFEDAVHEYAFSRVESSDPTLVYGDPPYLGRSMNDEFVSQPFTSYTSAGFDHLDQLRLSSLLMRAASYPNLIMLVSNANNQATREMYSPLKQFRIGDLRSISRDSSKRGTTLDLLVTNRVK